MGAKYSWYHNDHLGTPQIITDSSGRIVWNAVYDSFGNINILTEEITNNLRLSVQYFDAESGLYYNWFRYYDPETGRYLRVDPFGEGLNLYTYCFGNPVMYSDPYGLCVIRMAGGVMEVMAAAAMIGGSSGVCALPGYLMFINGIDNIIAGFGGLITGDYKPAILEMG
ncbi:MAG: RHS domain-containing protein, partial [Desulfobacterales bacterium]|nr:RHS domain-containing protein [Desulfobacterales bacterium]